MSGIINKIKDAVHSDKHSAPEGTHGPHNSRVANAADPRVDSDRDGSHHTTGNTMTGSTMTGRTAGHGETGSANPFTSNTHSNTHSTTGNTFGTHSAGTHSEGAHGPHTSRLANVADPSVDSDRDGSRTMGTTGTGTTGLGSSNTHHAHAGQGVTGMTGTHGAPAGTYGPHGSRVANAADPRIDSDRDGRGAIHSGPGPAADTAGPHKSDMMNKMDPRVDSDLDGSKTMGQQKTFQQGGLTGRRDPTDAAQVPPSVLREALGEPIIEHGDHEHHRARRNSVKTHQEAFSGI